MERAEVPTSSQNWLRKDIPASWALATVLGNVLCQGVVASVGFLTLLRMGSNGLTFPQGYAGFVVMWFSIALGMNLCWMLIYEFLVWITNMPRRPLGYLATTWALLTGVVYVFSLF
jgi:hypothetical protein